MRLRLTVQRNGLPAANILWNVPDTNSSQAYTITRLLEDVNHVIPLEAEQWGLEHYVVEVGGFECLHFSPVAQALKDDDHVSIRPLMTAEERARTLTGRHQISDDGRHLVDGIPFGRPYLRDPRRPAVRIPPRKRQRLNETDEQDGLAALNGVLGRLSSGENALLTNGDTDTGAQRPEGEGRASKRVRFRGPEVDDDDDSDEDDEDFDPAGSLVGQVARDEEEDETEDDSDFDSDTESDSSSGSDTSSSDSDSDSEDTTSDSDSESNTSAPPEVRSSKAIPDVPKQKLPSSPVHVAPGHGRPVTHSRNSRRTRTNRLRYLKEAGKLPPDANLKALDEYESANPPGLPSDLGHATPFSSYEGKRKRIDDEVAEDATQKGKKLEQRKQELMATLGENLDYAMVAAEKPMICPTTAQNSSPLSENKPERQHAQVEEPKKRLRPDTSAISRILTRQAMPSKRKQKTMAEVDKSPEPEGPPDPDFWKARINLSAFECWEEEFELCAPPYPFKQHWDPASKLMREKVEKKKQKGRRKRESMPVEEQEEEEEEEERLFLDYDDTGATENPDAEISAAIENQLRQDVATAAQSDLPPLPEDINTLSALASEDIKEGAIIVFKFFAVNPVTVTPEISDYKTAVVDREGDSGHGAGTIRLKIAQRDLPKREKKFDKKGNRIYEAADQFFMDDEEEDESIWEGQFSEMLEAKLLQAA